MGLLEDAIREHLELKRLRGADPAEVAREQQEALDAGAQAGAPAEDHGSAGETDIAAQAPGDDDLATEGYSEIPDAPIPGDASHAAQETAELDMQAVLADETAPSGEGEPALPADGATMQAPALEEDSLEWEVPARDPDPHGDRGTESPDTAPPVSEEHPQAPESAEEIDPGHAHDEHDVPDQGRLSL